MNFWSPKYIWEPFGLQYSKEEIETKPELTILGSCADDLVALNPISLLGEGGHLDVVAGEGLQPLQADLRGPGLLAEDQIRAWTEIFREGMWGAQNNDIWLSAESHTILDIKEHPGD